MKRLTVPLALPLARRWTSVANAVGVDAPSFGGPSLCKGPLPNLTA